VVSAIRFDSGEVVKQGQVLLELDSSVERAQLASAQARRDLARLSADRSRALVKENVIARSQADSDDATLKSTSADAAALQAQIERKVVRAPFSGRLGIRQVNLGQYLTPGTAITVLQAVDAVYVDFTLPQQQLGAIAVGTPVQIHVDGPGPGTPGEGAIAAIDPTLDAATRSIKVRAAVGNKDDRFRPGMFVEVAVVLPGRRKLVAVPATAIVHASYGDSVFVVEDKPGDAAGATAGKVARQQFVRTGESRGDFVGLVEGLKAGQEVVVAGAFKLRNGAGVVVNNSVKLDPKLQPQVENR
jgi:membrane fusion protein (multidrug efflux system)